MEGVLPFVTVFEDSIFEIDAVRAVRGGVVNRFGTFPDLGFKAGCS